MKNSIIIIVTILFTVFGAKAQIDHFTIQVDGLGCAFCAYGLEKKFEKMEGISEIKINLENGILDFDFVSEKSLSLIDVKLKVESAGYTPIKGDVTRSNKEVESLVYKEIFGTQPQIENIIFVNGNCEMCKSRIEKVALSVAGVSNADWDMTTKLLKLVFDNTKTNLESIEKAIVTIGHDTANLQSIDSTYNTLHTCCKYDRTK